jgi:AraC-like DNA-binding protein
MYGSIAPAPYSEEKTMSKPTQKDTRTLEQRLDIAEAIIRRAGIEGRRLRVYEVALDLDMSEFDFMRKFRTRFGIPPKQHYTACRAEQARQLLNDGIPEGKVARRIGLRRPFELRKFLTGHPAPAAANSDDDSGPITVRATPNSIAAPATA